jgi:hypothetical protein
MGQRVVPHQRIGMGLAMLGLCAAALAGCGGGSDGASAGNAASTAAVVSRATLNKALLGADDVPHGYVPNGPAPANSSPLGGACGGQLVHDHPPAASLTFQNAQARNVISEGVSSRQDAAAQVRSFAKVLRQCGSRQKFHDGTVVVIATLPAPRLGDNTAVGTFTASRSTQRVAIEVAEVQIDQGVIQLAWGGARLPGRAGFARLLRASVQKYDHTVA